MGEKEDQKMLSELEAIAKVAITRPEPCTPEYAAMREANEAFTAAMTPPLFLALLAQHEELKGENAKLKREVENSRTLLDIAQSALAKKEVT